MSGLIRVSEFVDKPFTSKRVECKKQRELISAIKTSDAQHQRSDSPAATLTCSHKVHPFSFTFLRASGSSPGSSTQEVKRETLLVGRSCFVSREAFTGVTFVYFRLF